jgi:hypothetical protein
MTFTGTTRLLLLAPICFVAAALSVAVPRVTLTPLGLAFLIAFTPLA